MEKLKVNKNISKKFISLTLTGVITLSTLIGCSNKSTAFKENNLKNISVIIFDDEGKDVANVGSHCSPRVCTGEHDVYRSVVDGEMFTDDECKAKSSADYLGTTLNKCDIKIIENITSYLTIEELEKANKNELTEEDISNIIARIFGEENKAEKTKKRINFRFFLCHLKNHQ